MASDEILSALNDRSTVKPQPYVHLGSNDSPVTTEMLVAGRQLCSSFDLSSRLGRIWVALLVKE